MERKISFVFAFFFVFWGCAKVEDGGRDTGPDFFHEPTPDMDVQFDPDFTFDTDMPYDLDVVLETDTITDSTETETVTDTAADPDVPLDIIDITPDIPSEPDIDTAVCIPLEGGDCNLITNCNCGAGEKCALYIDSLDPCNVIEQCAAGSWTLPTGSSCDPTADQCSVGNSCTTDTSGISRCYRWCDDDSDCGAGSTCSIPLVVNLPDCGEVSLVYSACEI